MIKKQSQATGKSRKKKGPPKLRDIEVSNLKIGALVEAIYRPRKKSEYLSEFVKYSNVGHGTSSGDFFWGRRFRNAATVVVGDASGHDDAYPALLSAVIGLILDQLASERSHKRLTSPRHVLTDLSKRFSVVIGQACKVMRDKGHRGYAKTMRRDGFDGACCVLQHDRIRVATAGLPAYVVRGNFKTEVIGDYDPFKHITGEKNSKENIRKPQTLDLDTKFIVFASDGIVDQENGNSRDFRKTGLVSAVDDYCRKSSRLSGPGLLEAILEAWKEHAGDTPVGDDCLVVVVDVQAFLSSTK